MATITPSSSFGAREPGRFEGHRAGAIGGAAGGRRPVPLEQVVSIAAGAGSFTVTTVASMVTGHTPLAFQ